MWLEARLCVVYPSVSSVAEVWDVATCRHTARSPESGAGSFELAAVCDPRLAMAEAAAEVVENLLGYRPAIFSDHTELIASGLVEALDVVTDPSAHHPVAIAGLTAGLHVICEKPLGITVRACRMILEAASGSGTVLATAENYRRDGPNRLARAVLEQGMLGEVHLMIEANVGGDDAVVHQPLAPHPRVRVDRSRYGSALHRHLLLLPR